MKIVGLRHQYISVKISYLACKLWASLVFAVCDVRVGVAMGVRVGVKFVGVKVGVRKLFFYQSIGISGKIFILA